RWVPGDLSFDCSAELDYIGLREFTAGGGPCSGDSGGPALLVRDYGSFFGVLSRGNLSTGSCNEGVFERTDIWAWLIARTVLDNVPVGKTAPAWATSLFPSSATAGQFCRQPGDC